LAGYPGGEAGTGKGLTGLAVLFFSLQAQEGQMSICLDGVTSSLDSAAWRPIQVCVDRRARCWTGSHESTMRSC
jgi:hypothetical protein